MLKLTPTNMFSIGNEDHTEETTKELSEQGAVSTADAEEVTAPVTPEADVVEAGDDIGQETPTEGISPDDRADITSTVTDDAPLDSTNTQEDAEVSELLQEGEQANSAKDEIVEAAITEATGSGSETTDTDINGNEVTDEQAEVNDAEDAIDDAVDDETEEEAAAKDIHQEAAEADENAGDELSDAINDDAVDTETTDDTSSDLGDTAGDTDLDESLDDDEPLEGAEALGSDATSEITGVTSTDGTDIESDVEEEVSTDDAVSQDTEETSTDVDTDIEKQNEAADVTAEAASSDVEQTDFIANDDPGQSGELSEDGGEVINTGDEVTAVADPTDSVDTDTSLGDTSGDVEASDSETEAEDNDDDVPLEGAEELNVNAEEDLTPKDDLGDGDSSAATVEESTTDQTAEDLQDGVDDVAEATAEVEEDSESSDTTEEEADATEEADVPEETSEVTEEVEAEEPAVDVEAGEVEETEEEADFDKGEVDVKDVDLGTTHDDVEEAMADAAEVGEWSDEDDKAGDLGDKTIEELQNEKESLETFRALLEISIAKEQYSPGILAYMNASVEPVRKRLATLDPYFEDTTPAKIALEDYSGKDMDLAYQATLESFRGMLSRLTTASHRITHQVEKWWSRSMTDKVTSRANALDKQIDLCLIQLQKADFSTGDITGVRGYLSTEETNLVKAVGDDLKLTTDIAVKGIKASEGFQNNLIKALNDVIGAGSDVEIGKALDAAASLKSIKEAFPSAAFSKGLLGGYKLEMRTAESGSRTDKLEALGHTGIPVGVKASKSSESATYKLSKGDIANLLKMAKTYVGIARKLADTTGDRAVRDVTKIRTTRDRALPVGADSRVKGDELGVDALATAMRLSAKAHVDLYKFITKHCVEVADACCGVAKKAIK